jgi:hypothetical protein
MQSDGNKSFVLGAIEEIQYLKNWPPILITAVTLLLHIRMNLYGYLAAWH